MRHKDRRSAAADGGTEPSRPNILYILADDMGYGDVACLNPESKIPTPNMDRVAREGMRFTDAHASSAVCTPSRYSILTGRYCWRSSLKLGVLTSFDPPIIERERLTVGELLRGQGYVTAAIGKWHLGINWPSKDGARVTGPNVDLRKPLRDGPTERGFDSYFGHDSLSAFIEDDRITGDLRPGPDGIPRARGWTMKQALPSLERRAVAWLEDHARQRRDKPFFMYFAPVAPHLPVVPLKRFHGKSRAGLYGDYVFQFDHTIGQLLAALDRTGLADNTLVIVTSDNGSPRCDGTNEGGELNSVLRFGHDPSGGFRGIKADAWDGGHRIPFLARWPGRIPAGTACAETICLSDLMATCADILGVRLPDEAGEDSFSHLPLLEGRRTARPVREATIHHSMFGVFCVRQGKWKVIFGFGSCGWSVPKYGDPRPPEEPDGQLYDMEADPAEQHNLWRERPDVVRKLRAVLRRYQEQGRSRRPAPAAARKRGKAR